MAIPNQQEHNEVTRILEDFAKSIKAARRAKRVFINSPDVESCAYYLQCCHRVEEFRDAIETMFVVVGVRDRIRDLGDQLLEGAHHEVYNRLYAGADDED